MLEARSKEINGSTYTVTQLPFTKARSILVLLTKRLGPGLSRVMAGAVGAAASKGEKSLLDGATLEDIAGGLSQIVADLDEQALVTLSDAFGPTTTVRLADGRTPFLVPETLNAHFTGRVLDYFMWLAFCIEVNYSDFFAALGPLLASAPAREIPKASP